jgi:hypothetical protein
VAADVETVPQVELAAGDVTMRRVVFRPREAGDRALVRLVLTPL